jgi:hypothetical protein
LQIFTDLASTLMVLGRARFYLPPRTAQVRLLALSFQGVTYFTNVDERKV